MGDRVIYVVKDDDYPTGIVSVYSHWGGQGALDTLERAAPFMRKGDVSYATARLCQAVCDAAGVSTTGAGLIEAPKAHDFANFFAEYSHGDAGVIVIDLDQRIYTCYAGYLEDRSGKLELGS